MLPRVKVTIAVVSALRLQGVKGHGQKVGVAASDGDVLSTLRNKAVHVKVRENVDTGLGHVGLADVLANLGGLLERQALGQLFILVVLKVNTLEIALVAG